MLLPRIIPCLLLRDNFLVKTTKFSNPKYIGDPLNAVKIFNEKEVDELIVLDIDASIKKRNPNYKLIEKLANESRMPFCYGGGITNINQMKSVISLGVEKIAISSSAINNPRLISEASDLLGSQSVVVVIDIRKKRFSSGYEVVIENGKKFTGINPVSIIDKSISSGAGEIIINSYDNDGMRNGYDLNFIKSLKCKNKIPFTFLGGADNLDSILDLWKNFGIAGAAAGSMFTLRGKYKAVLIQYPTSKEKQDLYLMLNNFYSKDTL